MNETTIMDLIINPAKIPTFVSFALLGSIILIVLALVVRGSMALVPRGTQNVVETVVEALLNLATENIGEDWGKFFFPVICTLFMYILICNFMGLIPGFVSPTSNINMTASMAVPVFFATHIYGIKLHQFSYIKHFVGPLRSFKALPLMVLLFIVEVVGHIARPITLSVRLFGNMIGKHIILFILAILAPMFVPIAILALGVLVSIVQAFVFSLLATLYLAGAVEHAH